MTDLEHKMKFAGIGAALNYVILKERQEWHKEKLKQIETNNNMTEPIPNLGMHITPNGQKLIYCGVAEELRETHEGVLFRILTASGHGSKTMTTPPNYAEHLKLYLKEKNYKEYNVRDNGIPWDIEEPEIPEGYRFEVRGYGWDNGGEKCKYMTCNTHSRIDKTWKASQRITIPCGFSDLLYIELIKEEEEEKPERDISKMEEFFNLEKEHPALLATHEEEKPERDMSAMEDFLKLVTPEVRERIIELSNSAKQRFFNTRPRPTSLDECFWWCLTSEGYTYWDSLYVKHTVRKVATEEKPERDISKMEDFLKLVTPEARERIIELSNDPLDKYFVIYPKPDVFIHCFTWTKTSEGYNYWNGLDDLEKGHPALLATHKEGEDGWETQIKTHFNLETKEESKHTLKQFNDQFSNWFSNWFDLYCMEKGHPALLARYKEVVAEEEKEEDMNDMEKLTIPEMKECLFIDEFGLLSTPLRETKEEKTKRIRKQFNDWYKEITGNELVDKDGDKYAIFVQLAKNLKM